MNFLIPFLIATTPQQANIEPTIHVGANTTTRKIVCMTAENKGSSGTIFYVGQNTFFTAYHVIDKTVGCFDDVSEIKLTVSYVDPLNDFAIVTAKTSASVSPPVIDCGGYKTGKTYTGIGWAEGVRFENVALTHLGKSGPILHLSGVNNPHIAILKGYIIPGMSGGPVKDENGTIVGMNTGSSFKGQISFSRELKDTIACQ